MVMINEELIAPCGMNCALCSGYLAYKNDIKNKGVRMSYCTGCRPRDKQCSFIKKRCSLISSGQACYCYECDRFPCEYLVKLDKRYRTHYRMSMIENLEYIKKNGIGRFLEDQEEKWRCPECGAVLCCHNGICFHCGLDVLRNRKKLYRWEDDQLK
jgi:hypothetical protein